MILLDIEMPVLDGYETLAALKADEALRDVPVIVISSVDELDSVVRCIRGGRGGLPAQDGRSGDPARPHRVVTRPEAPARPGARTLAEQTGSRHDRAPASRAVALPVAPGRRPGLERGRRDAAGRSPARDHRDVLRPAQLHGVLRAGGTGGGARLPARVPRGDGRADRRARGHARALRRRRLHDLLQRPGAAARPCRARRPAGGRDARPLRAGSRSGGDAGTSWRSGSGSRPAMRPWAASASRAATTTAPSAT